MADTVITPVARQESGESMAGWAVAVIILLAVILFGIFIWPGVGRMTPSMSTPTQETQPGNIDVNVRLPEGAMPGTNSGAGGNTNTQTQGSGGNTVPQQAQ